MICENHLIDLPKSGEESPPPGFRQHFTGQKALVNRSAAAIQHSKRVNLVVQISQSRQYFKNFISSNLHILFRNVRCFRYIQIFFVFRRKARRPLISSNCKGSNSPSLKIPISASRLKSETKAHLLYVNLKQFFNGPHFSKVKSLNHVF